MGCILADRLGLEFVDTDEEVERVTGKTVQDLFSRYGSIIFRSEETMAIKRVCERKGIVIATGGGAVLKQENVAALKKNGVVVLIRSFPEEIFKRVKLGRPRPLLAGAVDLRQRITEMMDEREEAYSGSADLEVLTNGESKEEVAEKIISMLRERNYI